MTKSRRSRLRMVPWIYLFKPVISDRYVFRVFPDIIEENPNVFFFVLRRSHLRFFRMGQRAFFGANKNRLSSPPLFGTSLEAVDEWLDRRLANHTVLDGGIIAWQAIVVRDVAIKYSFEDATTCGKVLGYSIIPDHYQIGASDAVSRLLRRQEPDMPARAIT